MLQVEAVVNPTNESLSDKNPISMRLFEVAGPDLREECKTQVGSECLKGGWREEEEKRRWNNFCLVLRATLS